MKNMKLYEQELDSYEKQLVSQINRKHNSKYLGKWCLKTTGGGWSESPVYVFYQPNPDREKRHSNYFGVYYYNNWVICNAESAFKNVDIVGIFDSGLVYVSRYRHDFISTPNGHTIDGGRDYLIYGINSSDPNEDNGELVKIILEDGEFKFQPFGNFMKHVELLNNNSSLEAEFNGMIGYKDFGKCVVRLSTATWHDKNGCYIKKSIKLLKRKSTGIMAECFRFDLENGLALDSIVNLNECSDGLYTVNCVNIRRDHETNIIDDYDYKLIPYSE